MFQGYYDRSGNSVERSNNGYSSNNEHQSNNHPLAQQDYQNNRFNNHNIYAKYNNNTSSDTFVNNMRNNKHMDQHQRVKQYLHQQSQELLMFNNYNNQQKLAAVSGDVISGGSGSYSAGSGGSGNYEDDFPELTTTKFGQLRLSEIDGDLSPIHNEVPSSNSEFCF